VSELYQGFVTFASALAAIAINALWQDALLVLCVWLLLRAWPKLNAATRYTVWCATLAAAIIVPVATTLAFFTPSQPIATTHVAAPAKDTPRHSAFAHVTSAPVREVRGAATPASSEQSPRLPARLHLTVPVPAALGIFVVWLVLAGYALVRLAIGLRRLEQLKRDALPLPIEYRDAMPQWLRANKGGRDVRLCVSDDTDVPVAVGLFDAMILIPHSLLDRLSEPEVDQICLHELAHLRRADDWTNGVQRLINALLGWNPAAQFVGQQLDLEREVACDDWVLSFVGRVRPYALCLTKMAESASWPRHAIPAPGVFATRKHISLRIERLLGAGRNIATNLAIGPAAVAVAVVGAIAAVIAVVAPSIAAPYVQPITVASTGQRVAAPVPSLKPKIIYLPAPHVSAPAQPAVPKKQLVVVEKQVTSPETHVNLPETHVNVPKTHVNLPETRLTAPGTRFTIPKFKIPVPGVGSDQLSNEISREIDRSMNAAISAKNAYSKVASQALSSSVAQTSSDGGRNCSGCDYRRVDWSGHDLRGVNYEGVDLTGARLVGTNFSGGNFNGVDFSRADLRNASFRDAHLIGCDFSNADLTGADFKGARINGCQFTHARLTSAEMRDVLNTCNGCDFSNANMSGLNLSNVRANGDDFSRADLRGVNFAGAQLTGMDFSKARLDGANFAGATLNGCDLSEVDLTHVDLSRTKLIGMDLSNDRNPKR
jgi:uncharacterized protein YjbI with pentapeptide repeats/beta-lactamase regulating signal transducer with metallopeptidase domain